METSKGLLHRPAYLSSYFQSSDKMERPVKRAGIEQLPLKDSFVAIKIHFGEPETLLIFGRTTRLAWQTYCATMVQTFLDGL